MDVERIIDEIQQLHEMFEASDIRPLSASDISAANRRRGEMLARSPWFRLWQHFGVWWYIQGQRDKSRYRTRQPFPHGWNQNTARMRAAS